MSMRRTSRLEYLSDPKITVFQNTIGIFDCKIKVFEYETADVKLSSFTFVPKTVQVFHHTLDCFVLSPV